MCKFVQTLSTECFPLTVLFLTAATAAGDHLHDSVRRLIPYLRDESAPLFSDPDRNCFSIADIGLAQVGLGDTVGAARSLSAIADIRSPITRRLADSLAQAKTRVGKIDEALRIIQSVNWPDWKRHHYESMYALVEVAAQTGQEKRAADIIKDIGDEVHGLPPNNEKYQLLFHLAMTQTVIGDQLSASMSRDSLKGLLASTTLDGSYASHLVDLAILSSRLLEPHTSTEFFDQALRATSPTSRRGAIDHKLIAIAQVSDGRLEAAIDTAKAIPALNDLTREREETLQSIAMIAATTNASKSESIAELITMYTQFRDRAFCYISEVYASRDETHNSLRIIKRISEETTRAHAMLELARSYANRGDRQRARELAGAIEYPRWNDRARSPLNSGPQAFQFNEPRTWGHVYQRHVSQAAAIHNRTKAADLAAVAMHCYVAIEGHGIRPQKELAQIWDIRKMTKALAAAGDSNAALAWIDSASSKRLDAILGTAEGLAMRLGEARGSR